MVKSMSDEFLSQLVAGYLKNPKDLERNRQRYIKKPLRSSFTPR